MKILKSIQIVFENCEYAEVHASAIEEFSFDVGKTWYRFGSDHVQQKLHFLKKARLILNSEYKNIHTDIDGKGTPFVGRVVAWNDITQIVLKFDDGKSRTLLVKWKGVDQNKKQKVEITDHSLIITL